MIQKGIDLGRRFITALGEADLTELGTLSYFWREWCKIMHWLPVVLVASTGRAAVADYVQVR